MDGESWLSSADGDPDPTDPRPTPNTHQPLVNVTVEKKEELFAHQGEVDAVS